MASRVTVHRAKKSIAIDEERHPFPHTVPGADADLPPATDPDQFPMVHSDGRTTLVHRNSVKIMEGHGFVLSDKARTLN